MEALEHSLTVVRAALEDAAPDDAAKLKRREEGLLWRLYEAAKTLHSYPAPGWYCCRCGLTFEGGDVVAARAHQRWCRGELLRLGPDDWEPPMVPRKGRKKKQRSQTPADS